MVMMVIIKMPTTMTGMNTMMMMMTMMRVMMVIVFSVPSMVGGKHQVQGIKARSVELP